LPILAGEWTPLIATGLALAVWIVAAIVIQFVERLRTGVPPPSFWGMQLAHLGIAVFVIGVTMVKGYEAERDVRMDIGDTVVVGGYTFRLLDVKDVQGPNYKASQGNVELSRNGTVMRFLHPEKRNYFSSSMPMTETAIDTGFTRDVYVSLGEPLPGGAWALRVYYKPFVDWIWAGCLLMALGGGVAAADRRYRLKVKSAAATAVVMEGTPA
jgi:cytochrome c-type biogenesis protein CcmF